MTPRALDAVLAPLIATGLIQDECEADYTAPRLLVAMMRHESIPTDRGTPIPAVHMLEVADAASAAMEHAPRTRTMPDNDRHALLSAGIAWALFGSDNDSDDLESQGIKVLPL